MSFVTLSWKISPGWFSRLFVCWAILFGCAVVVSADGTYQRTKDGKTLVWNEVPRPGDVAAWSGDRDFDDYATGFGTLTWYHTQKAAAGEPKQTLYAHYFGHMVRGKLDGPVNSHSNGITRHSMFTNGRRINRWAAGPVPSWTMPRLASKTIASETRLKRQDVRAKSPAVPPKSPLPQLAHSTAAPKTHLAIASRPTPNYNVVHEQANQPSKIEAPAEGPGSVPRRPAEAPPAQRNSKPEIDASLRALVGPPPALGQSEPESSDQTSRSSSSQHDHLSKTDVVKLSDAEARKRGYDLSRYDRPDPQFDPVDQTWSLSYVGKPTGAGLAVPKHFTVAIDDRTKRTAIVPAR